MGVFDAVVDNANNYKVICSAVEKAINHILEKGCDDIFRPPYFLNSLEMEIISSNKEEFSVLAKKKAVDFLKAANLKNNKIGNIKSTLILKDDNSYRKVSWMDHFDAVKYLSLCEILFKDIEGARISKEKEIVHSHRASGDINKIFDDSFGYDSFRRKSAEIAKMNINKWRVLTDISNFFDRIGNHSLENHLLDIGCEKKYVVLLREILLFWSGDRRSYGIPVGSDASRIISEAILIDIDNRMVAEKINFIRYVDDYRLFADTHEEATALVEKLTTLLSEEGLSLNSKKTVAFQITEEIVEPFLNVDEHVKEDVKAATKRIYRKQEVSGRSKFSKFYKAPARNAVDELSKKSLDEILSAINDPSIGKNESCKQAVKYFIYVNQDVGILGDLLRDRLTNIYYITDALVKEQDMFSDEKSIEVLNLIKACKAWGSCAYPYQIPVLRLFSSEKFQCSELIGYIFENYKHVSNECFFREAIYIGGKFLKREQVRRLAIDLYPQSSDATKRVILYSLINHSKLESEEKRPLIKNMKQGADDWFVSKIDIG